VTGGMKRCPQIGIGGNFEFRQLVNGVASATPHLQPNKEQKRSAACISAIQFNNWACYAVHRMRSIKAR